MLCDGTGTSTETGIGVGWMGCGAAGTVGAAGGSDRVWMKTEWLGAAGDALRSRIAWAADSSSSGDVRITSAHGCRLYGR